MESKTSVGLKLPIPVGFFCQEHLVNLDKIEKIKIKHL